MKWSFLGDEIKSNLYCLSLVYLPCPNFLHFQFFRLLSQAQQVTAGSSLFLRGRDLSSFTKSSKFCPNSLTNGQLQSLFSFCTMKKGTGN